MESAISQNTGLFESIAEYFNNLPYTIHLALQMQPPFDFFLWGYVKDQVYVPHLPASIPEMNVVTRYKQFGTNSIIVLMFVKSKRVHI